MTTRGWPRVETLASRGTYRVAIQQKTAARRALEWIGASKARLVFRYEISDLFFFGGGGAPLGYLEIPDCRMHTISHNSPPTPHGWICPPLWYLPEKPCCVTTNTKSWLHTGVPQCVKPTTSREVWRSPLEKLLEDTTPSDFWGTRRPAVADVKSNSDLIFGYYFIA